LPGLNGGGAAAAVPPTTRKIIIYCSTYQIKNIKNYHL